MSNRKRTILIILRFICLILFILSYIFDFEYAGKPTFFTVQSNIFVIIIMMILNVFDVLKLCEKFVKVPTLLYRIKFISTTAISLTSIVFCLLLTPLLVLEGRADVAFSFSSIVMHVIVPFISIYDWFVDDGEQHVPLYAAPIPLIFPLYYMFFAYIASACGVRFRSYEEGVEVMSKYPYFFLDYETYGFFKIDGINFGIVYWLIIIIIDVLIICFGLILLKNLIYYLKAKKETRNN